MLPTSHDKDCDGFGEGFNSNLPEPTHIVSPNPWIKVSEEEYQRHLARQGAAVKDGRES